MEYDPNELQAPPAPEAAPAAFEEEYEPIDDIEDLPVGFGQMGQEAASSDPNIVLHFASEPMGRRRKKPAEQGDLRRSWPFFSPAP